MNRIKILGMRMRKVLESNWWPVAAYFVMLSWLVVVNHVHIFDLNFNFTAEHYAALAQLDSTVHFAATLALSAAFTQVYGRRWTIPRLLILILAWEVFEVYALTSISSSLFTQPGRFGVDLLYLMDTLDDLLLGLSGTILGAYLTKEPN